MPKKHLTLYYFSGTGNSFRVSQWIAGHAEKKGCGVSLIPIEKASEQKLKNLPNNTTGIIFPTHGFTAPWHVIKHAWKLPSGKGENAFCITPRAGLKIGRFFVPGISGSAPFLIAAIMKIKGYAIQGIRSIDMPSNWFSLHPIQKDINIDAVIARAEPRVISFIDRILLGKPAWFALNCLYESLFGIILSPLSLIYLLYGRFFLAKLFFANNRCNGCSLCAANCSVGAISMKGHLNLPFWGYNCESCMRCATICPHNAVEAGHSWGTLLYFLTSVPYGSYTLSCLTHSHIASSQLTELPTGRLLDLLSFYLALILSYHIFFLLLHIPAIRYFFTHTTMTHYWKRYREPATNILKMTTETTEEKNEQ